MWGVNGCGQVGAWPRWVVWTPPAARRAALGTAVLGAANFLFFAVSKLYDVFSNVVFQDGGVAARPAAVTALRQVALKSWAARVGSLPAVSPTLLSKAAVPRVRQLPAVRKPAPRVRQFPRSALKPHGGVALSMLSFNGKKMVGNAVKRLGLAEMLNRWGRPSLVLGTELNGIAGQSDVKWFLAPAMALGYEAVWTQRTHDLDGRVEGDGANVGGGLFLLVHKRLNVTISEFPLLPFVESNDLKWLNGHLRVWRLDPRLGRLQSSAVPVPVMVTCAYIPPAGDWGLRTRKILHTTIAKAAEAIQDLRRVQDLYPVMLAHTNTPDGGCPLPLRLELDRATLEAEMATMPIRPGRIQSALTFNAEGAVVEPVQSRSTAKATKEGIAWAKTLALFGLVSLAGITGPRHPTSWVAQADNPGQGPMHSVHDPIFGPAELVWRYHQCPVGGRSIIRYEVRKDAWVPEAYDHAISYARLLVWPMRPTLERDSAAVTVQPKLQYKLPTNGLARYKTLMAATGDQDEYLKQHMVDAMSNDGVVLNTVITDGLRHAMVAASARDKAFADEARRSFSASRRALTVRQATIVCKQTQATLSRALQHRWEVGKTASAQSDVARCRTANQHAHLVLVRAKKAVTASKIAAAMTTDKKGMWRELELAGTEEGAAKAVACRLLECINDKDGTMITRDRKKIVTLLLEHRREVFAPHPNFSPGCMAAVNRAAVEIGAFNAEMVANPPVPPGNLLGFAADSIVVLQAADPLTMTRDMDAHSGHVRSLHDALAAHRIGRSAAWHRGQLVRNQFAPEVARLEREPELEEVLIIVQALNDPGNGLDKIRIALLKMQVDGITTQTILRMILVVWYSGRLPEEWREHRCLLLFKEKGNDPYHPDGYRGLGIDQILLKIMSLLMMARLETFLTATKGLSLAQGGFQRQRGCPEQAFTLSETVRAAILNSEVHLVFIDIERAYDSVLHPILWERCMSKGIGGLFLTTLQSLYHKTTAVMDVGGELLPAVPVLCGVLQGNPLSPLLFNIYIDAAIEDLEGQCQPGVPGRDFGLPLPRVGPGLPALGMPNPADRMPCLFFADDGALAGKELRSVQFAINCLTQSLLDLGLRMNVRKTKWLIVCRQFMASTKDGFPSQPFTAFCKAATEGPDALTICGQPIEHVVKFNYLGMYVNWRWNWKDAWAHARQQANLAFHNSVKAGWHNRGGSLSSRMDWAYNKIFCYLNYVAATAGCGGRPTTAPWARNQEVVDKVLLAVCGGSKRLSVEALRIEAGVWDQHTRIAMLQLRLWCKFLASPTSSYFYRAMQLSFRSLSQAQMLDPIGRNADANEIHRQPWAQALLALIGPFGLPNTANDLPLHFWHGLVRIEIDDSAVAGYVPGAAVAALPHPWWVGPALQLQFDAQVPLGIRFRLLLASLPVGTPGIEGVTAWTLPAGTLFSTLFQSWTSQLRDACYEALRRRANAHRQVAVRAFLQKCIADNSGLRRWASLVVASHKRAYWGTFDAVAAINLLHQRLDICNTEDFLRRRPYRLTRLRPAYQRLDNRLHRVCYLCGYIDGVAGVRWLDTLEHALLTCSHCDIAALRQRTRLALIAFAAEPDAIRLAAEAVVPVPDFTCDTAMWIALQLCTAPGVAPVALLAAPLLAPAMGMAATQASALARQAAPPFLFEPAVARATAAWVQAIQAEWQSWLRTPKLASRHETTLGFRFSTFVVAQSLGTFSCRRRLLRACAAYKYRLWDPVPAGAPAIAMAPGAPPAAAAAVAAAPQGGT